MTRRFWWMAILAVVCVGALPAWARFAIIYTPTPFSRLFKQVEDVLAKSPDNDEAHYLLGRLHGLAYADPKPNTDANSEWLNASRLPAISIWSSLMVKPVSPVKSLEVDRLKHLSISIQEYLTATKLNPSNARYRLGYGWMLEQGSHYSEILLSPEGDGKGKSQHNDWIRLALAEYREAFRLASDTDLKAKLAHRTLPQDQISKEAAENIIRLIPVPRTESDKSERLILNDVLVRLKKVPPYVTPIIFPLTNSLALSSLTTTKPVTFDLAVTGQATKWQWVTANAGILVWDPEHTGKVLSGAQLFGNRTWQLFFHNGYDALAMLDDNHDGWLTGKELEGIAIWIDRNGNGKSEKGEVVSLQSLGITGIAVHTTGLTENVPANMAGIRFADGTTRPTYDWYSQSVPVSTPLTEEMRPDYWN